MLAWSLIRQMLGHKLHRFAACRDVYRAFVASAGSAAQEWREFVLSSAASVYSPATHGGDARRQALHGVLSFLVWFYRCEQS